MTTKTKAKAKARVEFTCAAHWMIRPELWPSSGWPEAHQIGRCRFWSRTARRCLQYPDVRCPYRGWRDFTILQEKLLQDYWRQYAFLILKEENDGV